MLRGLIVRQGFMVAQALLGVLLVVIALSAIRELMKAPKDLSGSNGSGMNAVEPVELKSPIDDRAQYASILSSELFGDAGKYKHNFKAVVKKPVVKIANVDEEIATQLPLVLKGTVNVGLTSIFSSATIEIKEKGIGQKTFFIGDMVIDKVYLREIRKNEILLENNHKNPKRMEVLTHVLSFGDTKSAAVSSLNTSSTLAKGTVHSLSKPVKGALPNRANTKVVVLNRNDIVEKLNRDYEKLASTLDVIEKKDKDGNLLGLTVPDIETIPVAQDLGFKNGDILTSINNEKVTSQEQVSSLANKYQNSTAVRIGFIRDNTPMTIMYRLR